MRKLSAGKECPGGVSRPQLLPPVMVEAPVRFPTSNDEWVPLSVQPAPIEVDVEECDIVEMETDGWCRL